MMLAGLLPQAQTDGRRCAAFGSVRCASARAEYRDQHLVGVAADCSISLDHAQVCGSGIALVASRALLTRRAFLTWRPLRTLWSLRPLGALRAGDALNALRPLRSCRPLRARVTFGTGIAAACGQRK